MELGKTKRNVPLQETLKKLNFCISKTRDWPPKQQNYST